MATQAPPRGSSTGPSGGAAPREAHRIRTRRAVLGALAVLAALLALVTAASLPFAPVRHDRPVVTWPQDPAAPVSTSLLLVAHRPAALWVPTTCATARAAQDRGDGLLLSTMRPQSAQAAPQGLVWTVGGDRTRLVVAGQVLDDSPLPAGDCSLAVVTTDDGTGVQLQRDGQDVGEPSAVLPEVDTLATSLRALDAAAGEQLSATVVVNDEFASSPTPVKTALVVALLLSGVVCLVCVGLLDAPRRRQRPGGGGGRAWAARLRPRPADVAVAVLVVAWTVLAPMTDDDGYYAAMARNVAASGYVGQYYQLYDQSFVPLTWPWYALSWWTSVADTSLGLRVPAAVLGLATWWGLRRCADLLLGEHPRWGERGVAGRGGRISGRATALLALAFATAWTPYVMGVRPEAVSAAASTAALTGVLITLRTGRRLPLALAVVAAALSCAAHPTGAVAVAPLLATAPLLWRRLRSSRPLVTAARVLMVVAPGAMASAAGFADGTARDFVRGREVFKAVEEPLTWTQEIRRYEFLLNEGIPMGAYAKRTVVLLALLSLLLSLLLVAAARARRLHEGPAVSAPGTALATSALAVTATTVLLAFAALWVTPSKWTHHFGSLAGTVPLLLTALVLLGPDLARRALPSRGGGAVGVAAISGVVVVAAVSMSGGNLWPYALYLGLPHPGVSPYLSVVQLRSPLWWVLGALVAAGALALWQRRPAARAAVVVDSGRGDGGTAGSGAGDVADGEGRRATDAPDTAPTALALRTAGVTAVALMAVSTTYLVGSFAIAAAVTTGSYSPGAALLTDPGDERCGLAGAVSVVDDAAATSLDAAPGLAATASSTPRDAFTEGAGWWRGDPPPGTGAARTPLWGSLTGGDVATGELVTPWYSTGGALAGDGAGGAVTVLASGNLLAGGGNVLVAEYGVLTGPPGPGGGVRVTTVEPLLDDASTTEWRHLRLGDEGDPDPGPDAEVGTADDPEPVPLPAAATARTEVLAEGYVYDQDAAATADVVRLRAVDGSAGGGGWLAVGAPSVAPVTTMAELVPGDAVVAVNWQRSYLFPCQDQVLTAHGISARPTWAVLYGERSFEGIGDSVWQPGRGGLFAQVPEAATMTQLSSELTDTPEVGWGQLARIEWPYAADAYDLELLPEVAAGTDGPSAPALG